jgi:hypothetical protein
MSIGLFDALKAYAVWTRCFGGGGREDGHSNLFWAYWWPLEILLIDLRRGY